MITRKEIRVPTIVFECDCGANFPDQAEATEHCKIHELSFEQFAAIMHKYNTLQSVEDAEMWVSHLFIESKLPVPKFSLLSEPLKMGGIAEYCINWASLPNSTLSFFHAKRINFSSFPRKSIRLTMPRSFMNRIAIVREISARTWELSTIRSTEQREVGREVARVVQSIKMRDPEIMDLVSKIKERARVIWAEVEQKPLGPSAAVLKVLDRIAELETMLISKTDAA